VLKKFQDFIACQTSDERYLYTLKLIYNTWQPAHCLIAKFIDNETKAKTVCYLKNGVHVNNLIYDLAETPCDQVKQEKKACYFINDVQALFPKDQMLIDLNVDTYYGLALSSHHNEPSGIIVCLFEKHQQKPSTMNAEWLEQMSYLVGEELYYQEALKKKTKILDQLEASEDISKTGTWTLDMQKNIVYCSKGCRSIFELPDNQSSISLSILAALYVEKDLTIVSELLLSDVANKDQQFFDFKSEIETTSGVKKTVTTRVCCYLDPSNDRPILTATIQDVSLTNKLQKRLELSDVMYNHTSESIIITDAKNNIISVNPAAVKVTGFSEEELIGQNPKMLSSGYHDQAFYNAMWRSIEKTDQWQGEIYNQRKNGHIYAEQLNLNVVRDENGNIINHIAIFHDISTWKANEKRLSFYAQRESLTKLSNRRHFIDNLDGMINRNSEQSFALLVFDIVDFRAINDIYGHTLADNVLKMIASRLLEFDNNIDNLCRYGSDEFAILLPTNNPNEVKAKALMLHAHLIKEFTLQGINLDLQVKIGGAAFPENGKSSDELLQAAFYALQSIKGNNERFIAYHDSAVRDKYLRKLTLRDKLKTALKQGKLEVHYQPIIAAETEAIEKFEALVRFPDKEEGYISPAEFIPVAEHFGLVHDLGAFVLNKSCADLKKLHQEGFTHIGFSINRSISEFRSSTIGEAIGNAISSFGLPYNSITVEITESIAMSSNQYTRSVLNSLKEKGVLIALDDFGTGFSSLSNLIDYQTDILKIDKSFVDNLCSDAQQQILTSNMIQVAKQLGMKVIAEGVEDKQQLELLRKYDCDLIQGWYFSPAVPFDKCLKLLNKEALVKT